MPRDFQIDIHIGISQLRRDPDGLAVTRFENTCTWHALLPGRGVGGGALPKYIFVYSGKKNRFRGCAGWATPAAMHSRRGAPAAETLVIPGRSSYSDPNPINNSTALTEFRRIVLWHWLRALRRRGQRDKSNWASLNRLADRWIPQPKILHPWPSKRFAVKHPRWEPYAGKLHVRICAGGA
jgi:hypothetical protein